MSGGKRKLHQDSDESRNKHTKKTSNRSSLVPFVTCRTELTSKRFVNSRERKRNGSRGFLLKRSKLPYPIQVFLAQSSEKKTLQNFEHPLRSSSINSHIRERKRKKMLYYIQRFEISGPDFPRIAFGAPRDVCERTNENHGEKRRNGARENEIIIRDNKAQSGEVFPLLSFSPLSSSILFPS